MVELKQCKECELYFTQQFNYCPICGHNLTFMEKEKEEERKEVPSFTLEGVLTNEPVTTLHFTPEERDRFEQVLGATIIHPVRPGNIMDDGNPGHEIDPF